MHVRIVIHVVLNGGCLDSVRLLKESSLRWTGSVSVGAVAALEPGGEATQPKSKRGGMSTTYKRESVEKELVDLRLCPALALWGTKTRRTAEGRLPEIP